jgi:hypothetical protein
VRYADRMVMRASHSSRRKLASERTIATAGLGLALIAGSARMPAAHADEIPEVRAYGDAGTSELSLQLGFGSNYFAGGAGLRYFIVDGIAPGFEGSYQQFHGVGQGLAMASLRLAPLRFSGFVPVATLRAGRVFLTEHPSGWGVGGDVGVLVLISPHVAFEVGYGFLRLLPDSFCGDLTACTIYQPTFGLRVTF